WILEEPAWYAQLPQRIAHRQAELRQRHDPGQHHQRIGLRVLLLADNEAKEIAAAQLHGAKRMLAAGDARNRIAPAHALIGTQRYQRVEQRAIRLVRRIDPAARRRQTARELVFDLQPGQRQQLAIDDLQLQLDRLAEGGAPRAEAPPVDHSSQAPFSPQQREPGSQQERQAQQEQQRMMSRQANEQ